MNLVARVKNIVLTPQTEWGVIERESGDTGYLFKSYVAILAAIPAVCSVIGVTMLSAGPKALMTASAIVYAIVGYLLSFVGVWLFAVVIDLLAPTFGGRKNFPNALKLSAYSHTPYWLAGIFYLVPALSVLIVLGLYSVYLLWVGVPVLMKAPAEKVLIYTVAIVACAIVFFFIVSAIAGVVLYTILGAMLLK